MLKMNIDKHVELTLLRPDTTLDQLEASCSEAIAYKISALCVPPLFVKKAKELTAGSLVKVCTVVGYPLGYNATEAKVAEIVLAIIDGADDIEMVANTLAVKNNDWQYLANEINTILPIVRGKGRTITVVLETGLMTEAEIITACDIYGAAAVDYIKAGTGYEEDTAGAGRVKLIRKHLAEAVKIKSARRIINIDFACDLIKSGADRLSCNNGLQLVEQALQQN